MIYSIGHSSLGPDEFLALLAGAPAMELWDVRSYPSSHWPWFARAELERRLPAAGVRYRWVKDLGGRRGAPRRPAPPSEVPTNGAGTAPTTSAAAPPGDELTLFPATAPTRRWHNESFENYMWHMATPAFLAAAGELLLAGRRTDLAIMCGEALWWRCHRSMIADFVVYAGAEVVHLQPDRTPHSTVSGERLGRYAPEVLAAWNRHLAGDAQATGRSRAPQGPRGT